MVRKLKNIDLNRLSVDEYKQTEKFPVVVLLDDVRSMHNVGSIFRTADAFKLKSVYLCGITGTPPHKEIHKTALGSELSVDWKHFETITEAIAQLKAEGYLIAGLEQTEKSILLNEWDIAQHPKIALIAGSEVDGISQQAVDLCDVLVEIPQFGTKHSLNVSVATAVALWEVVNSQLPTDDSQG
jgi:23S rRNA (guanosine2251-2'-O)-methyltransferase